MTVDQKQMLADLAEIIRIAVESGIEVERERCAKIVEGFTGSQIKLAGGEFSPQEMRAVRAVQGLFAAAIRKAKP